MAKQLWFVAAIAALCLAGCATGEVGQSQIDQAYPEQSDAEIKETLAKEDPEALKAYEESQARDRARDGQTGSSQAEQSGTGH